jgi:hypothetical protein
MAPTHARRAIHLGLIVGAAVVGAALLLGRARAAEPPPRPPPDRAYDWCSKIAVSPDVRQHAIGNGCQPSWTPREIASGADYVYIGSYDDIEKRGPMTHPEGQCGSPHTHRDNADYVHQLRALRAAQGGPPLRIIHMHRFDVVADTLTAEPGFRADFLVRTDRPWSEVEAFFLKDRSPQCQPDGCRFTPAWGGYSDENKGRWITDWIRKAGGHPESNVYYLVRAAQVKHDYWPTAVLADLRNPDYRAWRVALAKRAVEVGGYDAVLLNQKFHQYTEQHWIGSPMAPDAEGLRKIGDDTLWTAPPRDYDAAAYLAGWVALAEDLRRAGVPYAVDLPHWPGLIKPAGNNGPADQGHRIAEVARHARIAVLDRKAYGDQAGLVAFGADLARAGVDVVWREDSCGFKRP